MPFRRSQRSGGPGLGRASAAGGLRQGAASVPRVRGQDALALRAERERGPVRQRRRGYPRRHAGLGTELGVGWERHRRPLFLAVDDGANLAVPPVVQIKWLASVIQFW